MATGLSVRRANSQWLTRVKRQRRTRRRQELKLNSDKTRKNLDISRAADGTDTQSRGRLSSGNEATGHPANSVVVHEQDVPAGALPNAAAPAADVLPKDEPGSERGTRGSGNPPLSGAGKLADDRPGRDAPKAHVPHKP
jgi:hypothetical protein